MSRGRCGRLPQSIERCRLTATARIDVDVAPHIGGLDEPGETTEEHSAVGPTEMTPLHAIPGSVAFGTLVHSVLEDVEFDAASVTADLLDLCRERFVTSPLSVIRRSCGGAVNNVVGAARSPSVRQA